MPPDDDRIDADDADAALLACPRCAVTMDARPLGAGAVYQCVEGHGIFLASADLGTLVEAENDWHRHAGHHTAPMPRITSDMEANPPPSHQPARAFVETLFRD